MVAFGLRSSLVARRLSASVSCPASPGCQTQPVLKWTSLPCSPTIVGVEVQPMVLAPTTEVIPLTADANGVLRVGNTRVTLDTVLAAFADGATAEEIVQQYPSLQLAD